MMGRSHAITGGAAGLAIAHVTATGAAVAAACWAAGSVAGLAPDLCHPKATIVRMLGPIGAVLCRIVRVISRAVGLLAHRGITHSAVVVVPVLTTALFAALTAAAPDLAVPVAAAAGAGALSALLGDWITLDSVRSLLWPLMRRTPGPPRWLRIRTGGGVETKLIVPVLTVATVALAAAVVIGWPAPAAWLAHLSMPQPPSPA